MGFFGQRKGGVRHTGGFGSCMCSIGRIPKFFWAGLDAGVDGLNRSGVLRGVSALGMGSGFLSPTIMSSSNSVIHRQPLFASAQFSFTEFQHTGLTVTVEIIVRYEELGSGLLAWHGMSITSVRVVFARVDLRGGCVCFFLLKCIRLRFFWDEL
jgi:hypothetical protein